MAGTTRTVFRLIFLVTGTGIWGILSYNYNAELNGTLSVAKYTSQNRPFRLLATVSPSIRSVLVRYSIPGSSHDVLTARDPTVEPLQEPFKGDPILEAHNNLLKKRKRPSH